MSALNSYENNLDSVKESLKISGRSNLLPAAEWAFVEEILMGDKDKAAAFVELMRKANEAGACARMDSEFEIR
ncbi:hypothetical protein [Streptosporangium longisporum]|uniref:Uncharacterized protein n=1 Tax=Streptosporangium longisporum TaxID=46187 RepID=A0ABP6L1F0_9ACTN